MKQVNIHEAKMHFSKLVQAASEGKTTIIARGGKPIAKIVPLEKKTPKPRKLGTLGHLYTPEQIEKAVNFQLPEDIIEMTTDKMFKKYDVGLVS
ncbi:type II toxin-antitoxin system prevent-host-death family antitoxin [Hellea sp.]|nr:type II toxin-antitoxin system prevent-host-death family antitoxin [Hellea sp.]